MKAATIIYIQGLLHRELQEAEKAREAMSDELAPYKSAGAGLSDPLRRAELYDPGKLEELRRRFDEAEDRIRDAQEAEEDFIRHDWH